MKHIKDRVSQYPNRKLITVESVNRNSLGEISSMYCYITRADGAVTVQGTPINKETFKFIRKGYRTENVSLYLTPSEQATDSITIDCLEDVTVSYEQYTTMYPFNLTNSYNEDTGVVTITATLKNPNGSLEEPQEMPFNVVLTSVETGLVLGKIRCCVYFCETSTTPND